MENVFALLKKKRKDVLLHAKNKTENEGTIENEIFPITRFENILGAPRLISKDTLEESYPSQYAFYEAGDVTISDKEYEACFGKLS